jgi:hypothetical protein
MVRRGQGHIVLVLVLVLVLGVTGSRRFIACDNL